MIVRALSLISLYLRVSVQNLAAYRFELVTRFFVSLMHLVSELIAVWTIFSNTDSLAGWRWQEMLVMVGVFRIVAGGIRILIVPNMRRLLEEIRDGTLDYVLLKPVDAQFLASIREVVIWRLVDIALGFTVAIIGCVKLSGHVPLKEALLFVFMLSAGFVIIYCLWLMLATLCFWAVRIQNIEMVFWNVFEAGRFPLQIYPSAMQFALTFIFPLAFLTTFPAAVFAKKQLGFSQPWIAAVVALAMVWVSRRIWLLGMRRYSGASA